MIQTNYIIFAEQLQGISDPRNRRGQHHEWQYLLLVLASALMAGQRSGRAMAQWAAEHGKALIECLQPSRQLPSVILTLIRNLLCICSVLSHLETTLSFGLKRLI